jgi:hypothetical protein
VRGRAETAARGGRWICCPRRRPVTLPNAGPLSARLSGGGCRAARSTDSEAPGALSVVWGIEPASATHRAKQRRCGSMTRPAGTHDRQVCSRDVFLIGVWTSKRKEARIHRARSKETRRVFRHRLRHPLRQHRRRARVGAPGAGRIMTTGRVGRSSSARSAASSARRSRSTRTGHSQPNCRASRTYSHICALARRGFGHTGICRASPTGFADVGIDAPRPTCEPSTRSSAGGPAARPSSSRLSLLALSSTHAWPSLTSGARREQ